MIPKASSERKGQSRRIFTTPTPNDIARLLDSEILFVSAAATAPTPSSPAAALAGSHWIGDGMQAAAFKRAYGCKSTATPRLRAIAAHDENGFGVIVDLDTAGQDAAVQLLDAVFSRVVVTHDAHEWLAFAVQMAPEIVAGRVIDLRVMARAMFPDAPYRLAERLAADEALAAVLDGVDPLSLQGLAATFGGGCPVQQFPAGVAWQLGVLSADGDGNWPAGKLSHAGYLAALTATYAGLLGSMSGLRGKAVESMEALRRRSGAEEFFSLFASAPLELARIQARGIPVSLDAVNAVQRAAVGALPGLVADLLQAAPNLRELRKELESIDTHATAEVRRALGAYAAANGVTLPVDENGLHKIGADVVSLAGGSRLPALKAWAELEAAKRRYSAAAELAISSQKRPDGERRATPQLSIGAVSGRMVCRKPAAQALDDSAKSAVRAGPGKVLIEADFGAIELRIAAAMAARCMHTYKHGGGHKTATLDALFAKAEAAGQPLASLLRDGLCPHDYTGLGIAERAGILKVDGSRLDYLRRTPRAEVRAAIGGKRKPAKVTNFGLLYNMRPAGLWQKGVLDGVDWYMAEAETTHAAWFDDFPEIAFARAYILETCRELGARKRRLVRRRGEPPKNIDSRLIHGLTLGLRPVVSHDDRIINLIAQGSGASMLLKAIVDLPAYLKDTVIMPVHDSLLLEVPEDCKMEYAKRLAVSMEKSADQYLARWCIPAVVEVSAGPSWDSLEVLEDV